MWLVFLGTAQAQTMEYTSPNCGNPTQTLSAWFSTTSLGTTPAQGTNTVTSGPGWRLSSNVTHCYADGYYTNIYGDQISRNVSVVAVCPTASPSWSINHTLRLCQRPLAECPTGTERVDGQCVPKCQPDEHRVDGICKKNGCPNGKPAGEFGTSSDEPTFLCSYYLPAWKYCMVTVPQPACIKYQSGGEWKQSCGGAGVWRGGACTPVNAPAPSDPDPSAPPTQDPETPGTQKPDPSAPPAPAPTPPDEGGNCAAGTHKGDDGQCYKDNQAPTQNPGSPSTCPEGMAKVFIDGVETCVANQFGGSGAGTGGTTGGGTGGGSTGGGGAGDCVPGDVRLSCSTINGQAEDGIGRVTKTITWTPDYVLGSGGGTCPADQVVTMAGRQFTLTNMAWACDKLSAYVRPMAILLATISAIFIVTGAAGGRPED